MKGFISDSSFRLLFPKRHKRPVTTTKSLALYYWAGNSPVLGFILPPPGLTHDLLVARAAKPKRPAVKHRQAVNSLSANSSFVFRAGREAVGVAGP